MKAIEVAMPALSSTMKEGKIVAWSKNVGDKVEIGDVLMVVESDKADMDVEAFEEGYLAKILTAEGGTQVVGSPVAILVANKDDIGKAKAGSGGMHTTATPTARSTPIEQRLAPNSTPITPGNHVPAPGVINATPKAKQRALENGVDVTQITGTGNFGRVTETDVLKVAGKFVNPAEAVTPLTSPTVAPVAQTTTSKSTPLKTGLGIDGVVEMTGMQKTVAKNMEKSMDVPVFRVSREITTDAFDQLYADLRPKGVTVSSLLAKAVAETLKKHPIINAEYVDGSVKYNKDINIAMAVAIDNGLITPTIIGAQDQDLFSISRAWKNLVMKAKDGKLSPSEYSSGTFYVSNLGMFGVAQFDAILPAGVGSILSIAASTPKVVQTKDGALSVKKSMIVTITCDHRHIYGTDAAEFLKDLANMIENDTHSLTMG